MNYNRPLREHRSAASGGVRFGERLTGRPFDKANPNRKFIAQPKPPPPAAKLKPAAAKAAGLASRELQIIFGKYQGQELKTSASPNYIATRRKVREALFSTLYRRTRFSRFLDVFAGCGVVGLEAISRGALLGTFIERSARMSTYIRKNMEALGVKEGHGEVVEQEALPYLKSMTKRRRVWDIIFLDPPPGSDQEALVSLLARGRLLRAERGILVVAHEKESHFPEHLGALRRFRTLNVKETTVALTFYENRKQAVK